MNGCWEPPAHCPNRHDRLALPLLDISARRLTGWFRGECLRLLTAAETERLSSASEAAEHCAAEHCAAHDWVALLRDDPGLACWVALIAAGPTSRWPAEPLGLVELAERYPAAQRDLFAAVHPAEPGSSTAEIPQLIAPAQTDLVWAAWCRWGRAVQRRLELLAGPDSPLSLVWSSYLVFGRCGEPLQRQLLPKWIVDALRELEQGLLALSGAATHAIAQAVYEVGDFQRWQHWGKSPWNDSQAADPQVWHAFREQLELWVRVRGLEDEFGQRVDTAKRAALREFAYGAGHEINNPLTNIALRAQTLLKHEPDAKKRQTLEAINRQAFRAHEMLADLMLYAKPPEPDLSQLDLARLVRDTADRFALQAEDAGVVLSTRTPGQPCWHVGDASQLQVALSAVLLNSLQACTARGAVVITLRRRRSGWELAVADTGGGMTLREREHLFDPFFSGREAGRGLGFGLCKALRIAELHGGQLQVRSCSSRGTTLVFDLPVTEGLTRHDVRPTLTGHHFQVRGRGQDVSAAIGNDNSKIPAKDSVGRGRAIDG